MPSLVLAFTLIIGFWFGFQSSKHDLSNIDSFRNLKKATFAGGCFWCSEYTFEKVEGVVEVDMFSEDVNSPDHPEAMKLKRLLLDVARDYDCRLESFEIDHGTVSFSFDNDELMAEVLKMLQAE